MHVDHLDRLSFDQFKLSVKRPIFLAVESYRCWLNRSISHASQKSPKRAKARVAGRSRIGFDRFRSAVVIRKASATRFARIVGGRPGGRSKVGFDILRCAHSRARHQFHRLPDLFSREFDVIGTVRAGAASGRYHHPDGRLDHRLRSVNGAGRRWYRRWNCDGRQ